MKNLIKIVIGLVILISFSNCSTPVSDSDIADKYGVELLQNYGYAFTIKVNSSITEEQMEQLCDELRGIDSKIVVGFYTSSTFAPWILKANSLDEACQLVITSEANWTYIYTSTSGGMLI